MADDGHLSRRGFLAGTLAGASSFAVVPGWAFGEGRASDVRSLFDRPMRWAQLTLVEDDPGQYDPQFWLDYFERVHADAACLSERCAGTTVQ